MAYRSKCVVCGRLRNRGFLETIPVPNGIRLLFDSKNQIYICKKSSSYYLKNLGKTGNPDYCKIVFIQRMNETLFDVSSGMTIFINSIKNLSK